MDQNASPPLATHSYQAPSFDWPPSAAVGPVYSNKSPQIDLLATALSKAQSQIKSAEKDSTNTFFKNSKYASLCSVWDAAREPLTKNGLSVIQTTDFRDNTMFLVTTLMHSSGQWMEGVYVLNPTKNDPQAMGGAMTYARRYALSAIVGITQNDDEGESAMNHVEHPKSTPYPPSASAPRGPAPSAAPAAAAQRFSPKTYSTKEEALEAAKQSAPLRSGR